MEILTVNTGSSSVRLATFQVVDQQTRRLRQQKLEDRSLKGLFGYLERESRTGVEAVAHRIVHGGQRFSSPCLIDEQMRSDIKALNRLAPLHNPIALEWIEACRKALPQALQIAVFDTSFFSALPKVAATYALPRSLSKRLDLRRYGFHGIAHQSLWRAWARQTGREGHGRLISFQLGAGCSAAALCDGKPMDTSMGFTPVEGLVMATRSGDLDPGLLLFLLREGALSPTEIEDLLQTKSGLLGLSERTYSLQELLSATDEQARLAVDVYCYRAKKYLGAYLAALGGADAVVFGGGVGEHQPEIRARILEGASFCGLELDPEANRAATGPTRISAATSRIEAWVLPVDEETALADEALQLLKERR